MIGSFGPLGLESGLRRLNVAKPEPETLQPEELLPMIQGQLLSPSSFEGAEFRMKCRAYGLWFCCGSVSCTPRPAVLMSRPVVESE